MAAMVCFGCGGPHLPYLPKPGPSSVEEVQTPRKSQAEINRELEELHRADSPAYRIAANDRFDFKVYDNEDLDLTGLEVMPDGYVSIGLIGPVKIGGLTIQEATALIETNLKKFINYPKISLIPTRVQSSTFTISGKVINPGIYPIGNGTRLTDAIAIAKGFATAQFQSDTVEAADLRNSFIARDGKVLPVDFEKAIRKGDRLNNIPLRHGDYIYIPSAMNSSVYVVGEVNRPTYIGFKDNLTLLQAVTYAQGLKNTNSANVIIVRGSLAKPKVYRVNIEKIMAGDAIDFPLQPNDIVFVPMGWLSEYNTIVNKLLPTLQAINLGTGSVTGFMH